MNAGSRIALAYAALTALCAVLPVPAAAMTCRALCPDGSQSELIDCDDPNDIPMCLRRKDAPAGSGSASGSSGNLREDSSRAIGEGIVHGDAGLVSMGILGTMISNQLDGTAQAARQAQANANAQAQAAAARASAEQQQSIQGEEARRLNETQQRNDEQERQRQELVSQLQGSPVAAPAAPVSHTPSYGRGYQDAAQCISQNAGTACSALSGAEWQTCLDDYRAGYSVGARLQQQLMDDAIRAGQRAGAGGQPQNADADLHPDGGCRTELIETYNRAWFQARHAAP